VLLVGGEALKNAWVFLVAPIVDGVLSALAHQSLQGKEAEQTSKTGHPFGCPVY
jgi:hypothetical protein